MNPIDKFKFNVAEAYTPVVEKKREKIVHGTASEIDAWCRKIETPNSYIRTNHFANGGEKFYVIQRIIN